MEYQSKQKPGKHVPSDHEILKAMTDFHTAGITVEEFCQMYEIDDSTFRSWNRKFNKMKNAEKVGLIEVPIPDGSLLPSQILFEVETFDGNLYRFYREGNVDFIKQLIGS